jgi:hypothetical protein
MQDEVPQLELASKTGNWNSVAGGADIQVPGPFRNWHLSVGNNKWANCRSCEAINLDKSLTCRLMALESMAAIPWRTSKSSSYRKPLVNKKNNGLVQVALLLTCNSWMIAKWEATISFVKFSALISSTVLKMYGAMKDREETVASRSGSVFIET